VLKIRRDDGPDILTFTEAGGLARLGLNSAGIAITANYLQSDRDYRRLGVPLALIRRNVLQQEHVALAMRTVYATPKSAANNMAVRRFRHAVVGLPPRAPWPGWHLGRDRRHGGDAPGRGGDGGGDAAGQQPHVHPIQPDPRPDAAGGGRQPSRRSAVSMTPRASSSASAALLRARTSCVSSIQRCSLSAPIGPSAVTS
jgi:hypothetical protein